MPLRAHRRWIKRGRGPQEVMVGTINLQARSAWGIKAGDRVGVTQPKGGLCAAGSDSVGSISGPGTFGHCDARFPVEVPGSGGVTIVVPYSGRGSEVELVRSNPKSCKI